MKRKVIAAINCPLPLRGSVGEKFAAAAPRSDDLEEPTLEATALERARSSSTHAVCKVPASAGPDSPGSAPAGRGRGRVTAAGCTRRAVGDLDLRAAGSAGRRGPAHGAAAQGRDSGGRGRVPLHSVRAASRPAGRSLAPLGAGSAPPLSKAAAVRSGRARTLHRPRSRYGPARPLARRGASTGSEPGGRAGTGVGSPRVPGNPSRGSGKRWASSGAPCQGLGMKCDRISESGFVTGSRLPSRLSPRLVFKRERRQRVASQQASRPGRSSLGRQCGGGPAISRGNMDLPLFYHQICLHVSLDAQLHLSSSRALMWPPR